MDYDDRYARWSYEQLLLQQPHVAYEGLWRIDWYHFIVCPNLETAKAADGSDLATWFNNNCCVIGARIEMVISCPPGAERVPERTAEDRAALIGAPRNRRDILVDMGLILPKTFPPFTIRFSDGNVVLVTKECLDLSQKEEAHKAFLSVGYGTLRFDTDPIWDSEKDDFRNLGRQGDLDLLPSRRLPTRIGSSLRLLLEEDEDFWIDNRDQVLAAPHMDPNSLLPETWQSSKHTSCFVEATALPPHNIRTYLSIYDTVHLALPIAEQFPQACEAMGVTPTELRKLVEIGRLKIVLPQPLDRYRPDWLSNLADNAPHGLLFSRRLAAATIVDARRRIPLLHPPLGPSDRYLLVHTLLANSGKLVTADKEKQLVASLKYLSSAWAQTEWLVQSRGAMGITTLGVGGLSATLFEGVTGRDLRLEFWSAGLKVSWAAALGSHAFPFKSEGHNYDETAYCDFVASVYSPIKNLNVSTVPPLALTAVEDILAIDNDVPVLDFAEEFSSVTIRRLRDFVFNISKDNLDKESLDSAIRSFNREVRHYEKRADRLKYVDIVGLLAGGLTAAGAVVNPDIARMIPLAGQILGILLRIAVDEAPRRYEDAGRIVDFLNAVLAFQSNSDAVLVARARKDVAALKA
ncbi:MAG: hypothetical protein M0003_12525 [Acidithiobacillus sp.]|nr:hypothetical protein [Acidithiobacillus sp.]